MRILSSNRVRLRAADKVVGCSSSGGAPDLDLSTLRGEAHADAWLRLRGARGPGVSLTQVLGFSRTISAFSAVANAVQPA